MAFTAAQLQAIETAIASGMLEVDYGGRRVRYQNLNALLRAKAEVERSIAQQAGNAATYRADRSYADFNSGFEHPQTDWRNNT